jgi:hypothetical protein
VDEFSNATAVVNWRFQWLWLYGFVHPSSGETYWWILPFVNSQLFERVLADESPTLESRLEKKNGFSSGWSRMALSVKA